MVFEKLPPSKFNRDGTAVVISAESAHAADVYGFLSDIKRPGMLVTDSEAMMKDVTPEQLNRFNPALRTEKRK